jgi:hypothetical protein
MNRKRVVNKKIDNVINSHDRMLWTQTGTAQYNSWE